MIPLGPEFLLLLGAGFLSGFLNVLAGGGSTLTLPLLIFMGLDGAGANGTNRIAILVQNIFSAGEFHRGRGYDLRKATVYGLWTLPGAVAGAFLATTITDGTFRTILAIVILAVIVTMLLPGYRDRDRGTAPGRSFWIYPSLLAIGFYGGFIQVGVGFMFMAALYHLLRIDLVTVNMYKVFIVLIYTIPALLIFEFTGNVDWLSGIVLAAGSALGGWLAARVSLRGGEIYVRVALAVGLIAMSLKLMDII